MKLNFKIVFSIVSFLLTTSLFAQEYSDSQIGFDSSTIKERLKEHGLNNEQINEQLVLQHMMDLKLFKRLEVKQAKLIKEIDNQIAKEKIGNPTFTSLAVPALQLQALMDLYNSTGGANWNNNTNWGIGDPSTWLGVSVDVNGNVIYLNLASNNLVGTLPSSICNLTNLQGLVLHNNLQLTGSIPVNIGNLIGLYSLNLSNCNLTGNIPVSICNLNQIQELNISSNPQLTGTIPTDIGNLLNLFFLDISLTNVTGTIPISIYSLINLNTLLICYNPQLTGPILSNIGNLINLTFVNLRSCNFTGTIPTSISNINNCNYFLFSGNQFYGTLPITSTPSSGILYSVSQNKFRFKDLLNVKNQYLTSNYGLFEYINQAKTDLIESKTVATGGTITFKMSEDEIIPGQLRYTPDDTFQWFKDGLAIQATASAANRVLTITNASALSAGVYTCKSTHPTITIPSDPNKNLVLERNPITLSVIPAIPCITAGIGTLNKVSPNVPCASTAINYNLVLNTTSTAAVTYVWSTWDAAGTNQIGSSTTLTGTAAAGSSFSNTFATAGTYTVRVVATQSGCTPVTFNTTTVVSALVTPIFTPVAAICSGSTLAALPTTSTNGIVGTWLPALNNTTTTIYTFTPNNGVCATTQTMTITVTPIFDIANFNPVIKVYTGTSFSIQLSYLGNDNETFQIALVPVGAPAPTSGVIVQYGSSYTFNNLLANVQYQLYVLATCGSNNTTPWTASITTPNICGGVLNPNTVVVKGLFVALINHLAAITTPIPKGV